jgi:hypothetical protein
MGVCGVFRKTLYVSFLEVDMPNLYITEVDRWIEVVVKNVAEITVPGASDFLNILGMLITARRPSEYELAMVEIKAIEAKVNNTFNVVVGAVFYARLRENFATVDDSVKEIFRLFRAKDGDYLTEAYEAALRLAKLDGPVKHQISLGEITLGTFASATATGDGTFLSYVGMYLHVISLVQEAVSNAQAAINMVLDELDRQRRPGDVEKLAKANIELLKECDTFITAGVPAHYPKWCKRIFAREPVLFENKRNPKYTIGLNEGKHETTLRAVLEGPRSAPEYAYNTVELKRDEDGTNARWHIICDNNRQWFTKSGSSKIYCHLDDNKGERIYDFPLFYESETIIIRAPLYPGNNGYSLGLGPKKEDNSLVFVPTKAHEPAIQWTIGP